MTDAQQREAARQFINKWKGYEKGETQRFWISLLTDVLGVENATDYVEFEKTVSVDGTAKFIDAYIPKTKVLIEQKSGKVDLNKPEYQSGGEYLTPYEQANRYNNYLNLDEKARWIVVSNFNEIRIHNMNALGTEPQIIRLENLQNEYKYLDFLVEREVKSVSKEQDLSVQAGVIVGKIYKLLRAQYKSPDNPASLRSLNALCVRLVFCMFAEDSGVFGGHGRFYNYMKEIPPAKWHRELKLLFQMLNTPLSSRDGYDSELESFPYVNGGLFSSDDSEIPAFTDELVDLILQEGCKGFNWRDISPTIFGAVFESTLNPETRRQSGMHYTAVEDIHKVIDPLFLNELKEELEFCKSSPIQGGWRKRRLTEFQDKLSRLKFFDPACGSGNFLTESYLSIRRLENEAIRILQNIVEGQIAMDEMGNQEIGVKVSIEQFYGIEINDFAVSVAKTAMWIAEAQMLIETKNSTDITQDFLPLTTNANIEKGNALRFDWEDFLPNDITFIMGNPPFVGYKYQNAAQKADIEFVASDFPNYGTLDYVSAWFIKASRYIQGRNVRCAFVATNSICQGEHVSTLWMPLFESGVHIDFAYRTFVWNNQATGKAAVHCVIVGFSRVENDKYTIFDGSSMITATNINAYLMDGPNIFVQKRSSPISKVAPIATKGNAAMDNGHLQLTKEDRDAILKKEPFLKDVIARHMDADDFLNGGENYCFWFDGIDTAKYQNSTVLKERFAAVREFRSNSRRSATKKMADFPMLFAEIRQPNTDYIMIPVVSSERREYIPIAFLPPTIINSYASISIPNATLYHFGILSSNVHNCWVRAIAGRLKSDYRYATTLVYNTFIWPNPTDAQVKEIEQTARAILDARSMSTGNSLSKMYDRDFMPKKLREAHWANNRAVMRAYGFSVKNMSEEDCVVALMEMYEQALSKL